MSSSSSPSPSQSQSGVPSASNAIEFFHVVTQLKKLKRQGWLRYGIDQCESVADHMYRMTMMCFLITDPSVDKGKLMKICLVHDLAEAVVGDITPHDGVSDEEKNRREERALREMVGNIGSVAIGDEIFSLWMEYETQSTAEAVIAKQLDKLEMIVQADEYEKEHKQLLDSFFESTKNSFKHSEVLSWANYLREQRALRISRGV